MHLCCSNYSQIQGRLGSTLDSERTMGRMMQGVGSYFATQSAIDEVKLHVLCEASPMQTEY